MKPQEAEQDDRNYFRVPCEFQIRFRVVNNEELKVFKDYALKPSVYSNLRLEIDSHLSKLPGGESAQILFEKAFQILMNIDQRLDRLEEGHENDPKEPYECATGNLGVGGIAFHLPSKRPVKGGQFLVLDMILPSFPEHRIVAAGEIIRLDSDRLIVIKFTAIHDDDQEFLHRFVIARERELLRARVQERDKKS